MLFRSAKQVGPFLDKELRVVADQIKAFMIAQVEVGRRHKLRRDGEGFAKTSKVTMTTAGGKITVPDYAEAMDRGRIKEAKLVPLVDLVRWIKRYRVIGRIQRNGRFKAASQDGINATARAIQRAIYRNGIIARPFIQATLDFQDELIATIVDEVMLPQIVSILELTFSQKK